MVPIPSQPATAGTERTRPTLDPQAKARLQRAVKEFESVMVGYMLKSMRSSVPKEEMFGDSYGGDMMEGMFDSEYAGYISRGSHLGLGEMLYKEITGEELPRTKAPAVAGPKLQAPTIHTTATPEIVRTTTAPAPVTVAPVREDPVQPASVRHDDKKEEKKDRSIVGPGTVSAPPDTVQRRLEALTPIIRDAADTTGVNPSLLKAVIATESAARTGARSSKNAKGLMQLIDSTAAAMGVQDVWDPRQNVQGGARYLGQMMDRFGGNIEHAVASYNAGPGAVEKHNGVPPYKETQAYVGKVLEYLRYFEQQETGDNDQD
jgi:Rod binding domain-containing protein